MSPSEVHPDQSVTVALDPQEAGILYELVNDLCNETADGGSIPPRAWRTAANKMQAAVKETEHAAS